MRLPRANVVKAAAFWGLGAMASLALAQAQNAPTSQPTTNQSMVELHRWLSDGRRAKQLSDEQIALKAAVAFVIAAAEGQHERAASLVDAVGYQALPASGALPEPPTAPLKKDAIRQMLAQITPVSVDGMRAGQFEVLPRKRIPPEFSAAAVWMLDEDWLVVMRPEGGGQHWLREPAHLVIRLRARKPTIVAGTLLDAWQPAERSP